ncbi:MAG: hypothetical protein ACFFB3_24385 [Candidatus Hodarchaeota archaeon]
MSDRIELDALAATINQYQKKVREAAEKWQRVQQRSLVTVNTIMGLVSKLVLSSNKALYSKNLSKFYDIEERLTAKLIDHIGRKIPELRRSVDFLSSIVREQEDLRKQLVLNLKDTARYFFDPGSSKSSDWRLIEQAEDFTNMIVEMYSTELQVRLTIVHEMESKPLKPAVYSLLMTIWAAEPYIELGRLEDILEEIVCLEETLNSRLHEIGTATANPV